MPVLVPSPTPAKPPVVEPTLDFVALEPGSAPVTAPVGIPISTPTAPLSPPPAEKVLVPPGAYPSGLNDEEIYEVVSNLEDYLLSETIPVSPYELVQRLNLKHPELFYVFIDGLKGRHKRKVESLIEKTGLTIA